MSPSTLSRSFLTVAWMLSLAVAAGVGWKVAKQTTPPPDSLLVATPPLEEPRDRTPLPDVSPNELQAENERLKADIETLRQKLRDQVDGQKQRSSAARDESREAEAARLSYYLDRYLLGKRSGGFLSGLDEAIELAINVARAGEVGIERMRVLALEGESADVRELAVEILSFLPSKTALDTLMEYPPGLLQASEEDEPGTEQTAPIDESGTDRAWKWEAVVRHIESLPTEELAAHLPAFDQQLARDASEGSWSEEARHACAQLAFRHGDNRARVAFESLWNGLDPAGRKALTEYLVFVESPGSRDFLELVASSDNDAEVREIAREGAEFLGELFGSHARKQ